MDGVTEAEAIEVSAGIWTVVNIIPLLLVWSLHIVQAMGGPANFLLSEHGSQGSDN